ncbi:putative membrane protein [Stackebrandtia albiflava]|uniref:Putative membrane protein n=1 Tax=Stackebrandtia albiflava TaxID=406432 RepID=A0A562ULF0_9ACTN|nr:YhgE/Pip family protein [Stackebrandtia albiflava]TWJ06430.1 putative membrane protein [Stackebrandtia albiflava]
MTALRLALLELRRFRGRPLRCVVLGLVVAVPILVGGLALWSQWDPYGSTERIPVALVDRDTGAVVEGRHIDAGAELAGQLQAGDAFDWHPVTETEAIRGVTEGDYAFAVVVPADFSRALAGSERPHVTVRRDDSNGYLSGVIADTAALDLRQQIDTAVYVTAAKAAVGDLTRLDTGVEQAAHAAGDLTDDARNTADQADRLHTGLTDLELAAQRLSEDVADLRGDIRPAESTLAGRWPAIQSDSRAAAELTDGFAGRLSDIHGLLCDGDTGDACRDLDAAVADARAIDDGVTTLDEDIQSLSPGGGGVTDGRIDDLVAESQRLTGDTAAARTGAERLAEATDDFASESGGLADTLTGTARSLPAMDPARNAAIADLLGSPVDVRNVNAHPADVYGRGMAPLWFGIALWLFATAGYLVLRSCNPRALAGRTRTATIALAGWLPSLPLAVAAVAILYAAAGLGLGLDAVDPVATVAVALSGAAVFTAVGQLLRLVWGGMGGVAMLVLLTVQVPASGGAYPIQTSPAFFQALHPLMPMTYLVDALRITVTGGEPRRLWQAVLVLAVFGVAALLASTLVTAYRRRWTVARLHPVTLP